MSTKPVTAIEIVVSELLEIVTDRSAPLAQRLEVAKLIVDIFFRREDA